MATISELHVRQIRAYIEQNLGPLIDLSDYTKKSPQEKLNALLTRGQMSFVLSYLSGVSHEEAARAITDGYGDNGIDGVLYHSADRILYIGQSKWKHDGTGSIDRGELQKFLKGFRDLINARWDRFNEKMKAKATMIDSAINSASTRIVLVLTYTGQDPLASEINQDLKDLLQEMNDTTEIVTDQVLRQSNIYSAVSQGSQGSPIDLEVALYDWGQVREPYQAFYGQVSAADVANWHKLHQNHLFAPNIRMFLGATDVNSTILETITSEPRDFWYFNNGISALCRTVKKKPIGGNTRETGIFECHDLRIVNGAQTVGAIASASIKAPDSVALARVTIKLVSLEDCPPDFDRKVTRYNNTQNRIDRRDFVALDEEQERIRGELLLEGVTYAYKSGEAVPPSSTGFGLDDATVARACLQPDVTFAVQAKREIGKLWEDITKAPYKVLFNPSVSGPSIWRAVQITRAVEFFLSVRRPQLEGRERLLTIHGNRFITHLVFQCLPATFVNTLQPLNDKEEQLVVDLSRRIFESVFMLVEIEYSDAYLATLFKNNAKCQSIKDVFACP